MFSRVVFNQAFGGRIYNGTRIRTGYAPTALFAAYTNSGSGHGTPLYPPATRETCGTPEGDQADRDLTETTIQTGTRTPPISLYGLLLVRIGFKRRPGEPRRPGRNGTCQWNPMVTMKTAVQRITAVISKSPRAGYRSFVLSSPGVTAPHGAYW